MLMRRAAARCGEWAQHFQMLLVTGKREAASTRCADEPAVVGSDRQHCRWTATHDRRGFPSTQGQTEHNRRFFYLSFSGHT